MDRVRLIDKDFGVFIAEKEIKEKVEALAGMINTDLEGEEVVFIGILNGSFMFAADLYRRTTLKSQLTFLKLASYSGTSSTGEVKKLIGLNEQIRGKTVVVIEDIVDTGRTLEDISIQLKEQGAAMVRIATLLLKPDAFRGSVRPDYVGFEIPNDFVVGYGLDYNGFGRNLPSVYKLIT